MENKPRDLKSKEKEILIELEEDMPQKTNDEIIYNIENKNIGE